VPGRLPAPLLLVAVGLLLSGCGGSARPPSNGIEEMTAAQALTAVKHAVAQATSVRISGTAQAGGKPLTLDLELAAERGGAGHVTAGGISFDIIRIGRQAYVRGDRRFWANFTESAALQTLLAGKWLSAPADSAALASLTPVTNLTALLNEILAGHGPLTMGDTTEIDGTPAIAIVDGATGGKLYVATTGPAYPLELQGKGKTGAVTFKDWDVPVPLEAPARSIDFSKLAG
jgi:hypothetical protein